MVKQALAVTMAFLATALTCGIGLAQDYPTKPIRMIVPFTPGGGTDLTARIIATGLAQTLGQQVIVENRPGAGTVIGSDLVARATPDGYTLIMQVNSLAANHTLYRKLPYDTLKDFVPVVLAGSTPNVLVVHPSMPVKSPLDFVALARKRPGEISYASSGVGGASYLATELFKLLTGIQMLHVPYKGTAPALTAILSGEAQAMVAAAPGTLSFIKQGRLRALGVTSAKRWPPVPDLPTVIESGIKDFEFETWYGIFAPGATPMAVVNRLNKAVNQILALPETKEQFSRRGVEPAGGTQESFVAYFRTEIDKLGKVIRATGAKVE